MTAEDLRTSFPNAIQAILYLETIIRTPADPGDISAWDLMMTAGIDPAAVADMVRENLIQEIEDFGESYTSRRSALGQMTHQDFLRYVCGLMGAV